MSFRLIQLVTGHATSVEHYSIIPILKISFHCYGYLLTVQATLRIRITTTIELAHNASLIVVVWILVAVLVVEPSRGDFIKDCIHDALMEQWKHKGGSCFFWVWMDSLLQFSTLKHLRLELIWWGWKCLQPTIVFSTKNCVIIIRDTVVKMKSIQKNLLESEPEPLSLFQLPSEVLTRQLFLNWLQN